MTLGNLAAEGHDAPAAGDHRRLIERVQPMITHLCGQEAHAAARQATVERARLLVTLTGGTAAFVVPATLLPDGGTTAYRISAGLMVFVLLLGGYYRWQASVWRLVVIHLQKQRLTVLEIEHQPLDLSDNGRLYDAFARRAWLTAIIPDPLQVLAIVAFVLVAVGPWLQNACPPSSDTLDCLRALRDAARGWLSSGRRG